tara:strand:+ start:3988 stop:5403 length:1416 start_codon:yes stop_codon:yes gene_type:complete
MTKIKGSSSSLSLDVTSPFDGALIQNIAKKTAEDAELMLQIAHTAFKNRVTWLEPHERIAILHKLADLVRNESEQFAMLIASEGGKPLMDAKIEVARAIDGIDLAAKELSSVMSGKEIPMGYTKPSVNRKAFTTYEPIGVVVAISAFNHPLNLIVHQVVPAIAVGCPVIVKPASSTPLNCIRFVELVHQAGLPLEWCQVCVCDSQVAEKLATDKRIGFMSFIGSGNVGWALKNKLAPGVRCALEHGGVAPVIIDNGINVDEIIAPLLKGAFYHAGQVCVSVQRIYAPSNIAKKIAKKLAAAAAKLIVGDAKAPDTEVGPLISPREVTRVEAWVNDAIESGAKCLTGGKRLSDSLYAPTVLLNPTENAKVSMQEVFGPVVCVYAYDDRLEAIDRANQLDFAFQASVFTNNLDVAFDTVERLDASTVVVNDHTAFRVDWMPFGGRRHSGYGMGGIGYTMHDMLQSKMAVFKTN